jgi:hypothetical protein
VIASALLLRGSAEGVSSYRIFGDEAYPQQIVFVLNVAVVLGGNAQVTTWNC